MCIRKKEDFIIETDSIGYKILYRSRLLTGAGVNKVDFSYDGRRKPIGRRKSSEYGFLRQDAEVTINACLAGIPGRYLDRCKEIDAELDEED